MPLAARTNVVDFRAYVFIWVSRVTAFGTKGPRYRAGMSASLVCFCPVRTHLLFLLGIGMGSGATAVFLDEDVFDRGSSREYVLCSVVCARVWRC